MKSQLQFFAGLSLYLLLSLIACSQVLAREKIARSTEIVQRGARGATPTPGPRAPQPVQDEGRQQAEAFWNQRTVTCGDQTYMGYANLEVNAMKGFRINVRSTPTSEADRLNGLQWQGSTNITASASRTFLPTTAWQPWQNGMGFGDLNVAMVKTNGAWRITPSPYSAVGKAKKLSCSDIPPDVIEPGSAWHRRMIETDSCFRFMRIDSYLTIDELKTWIDQPVPLNLNTCRNESDGMTPLMKAAVRWEPNLVQLFLQRGANPQARDNSGRTALEVTQATLNEYLRTTAPSRPPQPGGMLPPDYRWRAVIELLKRQ